MGRRNFSTVYTDVSPAAGWRATVGVTPAWSDLPAFATFPSFNDRMVSIDWMHSFHMGVARDLLGAGIKIIAGGKGYFDDSNIDLRLKALLRDVKSFAKSHGKGISITKLTKSGLGWSGGQTPEFKGSAADSGVFLSWMAALLQRQPPKEPWVGLAGVVFCVDRLCSILLSASVFLSDAENRQVRVLGNLFINGYIRLASTAMANDLLLFKVRPKYHFVQHMLEDCSTRASARNCGWDAVWMDEDFVKYCMRMYRRMSRRCAALNILRRNLVTLKKYLEKHV